MRFVLTRDPSELSAHADAFIAARIERNVLATVLINALAGRYEGLFAYGLDDRGGVAYAGLRTPPWPLLTSDLDPRHARDLVATWLEQDPDLNGVNGVTSAARAIASAWAELTGGTTRLRMSDAMHTLTEVRDPPWPATGALRVARAEERELAIAWMRAFIVEAEAGGGAGEAERLVDARLGDGGLLMWDDGGPACVLGVAPQVAGVVRIGPVYTPPERRRRGYAGTAVAAASRRALERGAARCMLFTDLSNPTSNKIYAEVGYERFGGWEEHVFDAATPGTA